MTSSSSTPICVPNSRSHDVGLLLAARAERARTREDVEQTGFTRFRRVAETPFNLVYQVRS